MTDNIFRRILKGSATTTFGTGISMLLHFVSIMIITRGISKEEFGSYALIIVLTNFINILGSLGLDITLVKFISGDKDYKKNEILLPVAIVKLFSIIFLSILFLLLSGIIIPLISEHLTELIFYFPVLFIFSSFRDLGYKVFQSVNLYRNYVTVQISSALLRICIILALFLTNNLNLGNLVLTEMCLVILTVTLQFILIPIKRLVSRNMKSKIFKDLLNFSIPLYFNSIFTFMYGRVNLIIIALLLNPASVGLYDAATKVPEALKRLFNSFIVVYFPNISNLFSNDNKHKAEELMNGTLIGFSTTLTIIILISFLFNNEIIVLIFSAKYAEVSLVFSLLMLNFSFRVYANILGYSILAAGFPKVPMKVNIVSSLISVGGSFLLIPKLGIIGVVIALLVMNSVAQLSYIFYHVQATIKVAVKKYLVPTFLLTATLSIYYVLNIENILIKIVILLTFILLLWLLIKDFREIIYKTIAVISKKKTL
ncbi:MAG: oligosaccharide flippase family protein [Bacteroidetes bacterium]|nr:oligosaccharide flippase family protein [Bacteroidota bacterium]